MIDASQLDTSKAGEYKVKVTAVDKAGNEATKEFTVKVNAKKEDKETNSSSSNSSTSNKNNSSNKTNTSSKNNSTSNSSSSQSSFNDNNTSTNSTPQQTCTTVWVQDTDAYDETIVVQQAYDEWVETSSSYPVIVCNGCGAEFRSLEEYVSHRGTYSSNGDWSHGTYYSGTHQATGYYEHHDAVTHTVHHDATGHNETRCQ